MYTCRDCNAIKTYCEYCSSSVRFSGLRAHIMSEHPALDLPRGFCITLASDKYQVYNKDQLYDKFSCKYCIFL